MKSHICWRTNTLNDLYFEYRSLEAQMAMCEYAINHPTTGPQLLLDCVSNSNRWFRNVNNYVNAKNKDSLHQLTVPLLSLQLPAYSAYELQKAGLTIEPSPATLTDSQCDQQQTWASGDVFLDAVTPLVVEATDAEVIDDATHLDQRTHQLVPCSQPFLYRNLCCDLALWKRPPHDHCDRCQSYLTTNARVAEL